MSQTVAELGLGVDRGDPLKKCSAMSEGTGRGKSWLWLPLRHMTACYCSVESFSQGSKEQHSNKQ